MAVGSLTATGGDPVHDSADLRQRVDAVRKLVNNNMSDFDEGARATGDDGEVTTEFTSMNVVK